MFYIKNSGSLINRASGSSKIDTFRITPGNFSARIMTVTVLNL